VSKKPDFKLWAREITSLAECGEGIAFNLPYDLATALEDAYRLGHLDASLEKE